MFSSEVIKAMNGTTSADLLTCEACDYPMGSFYEYDGHKVCFECKFEREVGTCENCETFGVGATSWGGWCHDCDNSMS